MSVGEKNQMIQSEQIDFMVILGFLRDCHLYASFALGRVSFRFACSVILFSLKGQVFVFSGCFDMSVVKL